MTSAEAPTVARQHAVTPQDGLRLPRGLDALLDGIVVAFAAWTIFYEAALAARLNLWVPSLVWLAGSVVAVTGYVVRTVLRTPDDLPAGPAGRVWPAEPAPSGSGAVATGPAGAVLWVMAVVALVLAVLVAPRTGELPVVLLALLVLALGLRDRLRATSFAERETKAPGLATQVGAVAVSAGLGVFTAFLVKPNGDDVYYVNRSAWVADHGFAALRDTMFGPQTYRSTYGGGLPLTSVEPLFGGLAHALGVQVGAVVYLVAPPVLGALTGLAMWRLVRSWAPRRHLLVLVVAVAFLLFSGETIVGGYSFGRIWEGKVVSYCLLLPLVWAQLARVTERGSPRDLVLLGSSGVALVGLSATAPLQGAMIGGPALVAAALLRRRWLALGAAVFLVAPVVAGLVQVVWSPGVGGADPHAMGLTRTWQMVFGHRPAMIALGVLAYAVAVQLPRGRHAVVVTCAALAAMATLLPGVFGLVNRVTGAGPVEWRLLIAVPTAVLVGLLVTLRLPATGYRLPARLPQVAVPVLVVALVGASLLGQGRPIWRTEAGGRLGSPLAWKLNPDALSDVRLLMRAYDDTGPGPWLLPSARMQVLTVLTTRHAAVVPRAYYVSSLQESPRDRAARQFLYRFVEGALYRPDPAQVRRALTRLHVSLACVNRANKGRARVLAQAAGDSGEPIGGLECHKIWSAVGGHSSSTASP